MSEPKRYRRKPETPVTAIQIDLEFDGFTYRKWGDDQRCKQGDWLLEKDGDVYTVRDDVFEKTYRAVEGQSGRYEKFGKVWARQSDKDGSVDTLEGRTHYQAGWFIVANDPDFSDVYAMSEEDFLKRYEPDN